MTQNHSYQTHLVWTGNRGTGTETYKAYDRDYNILITGKPSLPGSSDPAFRGDKSRHNPEDMLLGAISSCHMLWYLHLCSVNKITVLEYEDRATATMSMNSDGSGQFTSALLRPEVTISKNSDPAVAEKLHHSASEMCFIARSVNFPIKHEPIIRR
ncbi:OsmC family protein [Kiloniella laminariae]|uniref:OsmC family protein n=1 Tax=Kiloniella laminariae TaxID=454162 RepID=A0ABT4LDM7_9PROT|nr:OsmC family protein [Kiloniella laminariae]MCZ4279199.1 OsmC family protein [Kiloniella laminariae]